MAEGIFLEGGAGGGDGQILRTALALSLATGKPFEMLHIRSRAAEPGLGAQHLAALQAAADLGAAEVEGAQLGSQRIRFGPGRRPPPGEHAFAVPAAGSAGLLLQTLTLPLALSGGTSHVVVQGGTHVPGAPTAHDLALSFIPLLSRLRFPVELSLGAAGFPPDGGGSLSAVIRPNQAARPLDLRRRGTLREVRLIPMSAGVEAEVPLRMAAAARRALRLQGIAAEEEGLPLPAGGSPGSALALHATYENLSVTFGAVAGGDEPAESVGQKAAAAFTRHHATGMAVDGLLADQLLLPLALGSAGLQGGPTPIHRFTCTEITPHLTATAAVIRRFLPVEVAVFGREGEAGDVRVAPEGTGEIVRLHGG